MPPMAQTEWRNHALNNLLGKIMASAELALDRVSDTQARTELSEIIELAEAGALLLRALGRQGLQAE